MKVPRMVGCATLLLTALCSLDSLGADGNSLALELLTGKFEGTIQVDKPNPVRHSYQTEVVRVDLAAKTVSLTATCPDCGTMRWERNSCEITEVQETISFVCRGPASNEEYVFDGERLIATGFGNNYPYSIRTIKVPVEEALRRR